MNSTGTFSTGNSSKSSTESFRYEDSSIYSSSAPTSSSLVSLPEHPNIYSYSEICSATNNFYLTPLSSTKYAWHCSIRKKDVLVVQRKLRRIVDISEIEDRLSTFCDNNHFSVIKLLGASIMGCRIFLVYDYVFGADLANCLRNPLSPVMLPSWTSRMRVATDVAQGLEHIHYYMGMGLDKGTIHNHLSSRSVIVTEKFLNAKICHFGTAELCGEIFTNPIEESELISGRMVSQKSDVFALGVLLLEIFSGDEPVKEVHDQKSGEYKKISLIDSARDAIESRDVTKIQKWVDKRIRNSFPIEVAEKMMRIGLDCVQEDPEKRPDIRHITSKIRKICLEGGVLVRSKMLNLN